MKAQDFRPGDPVVYIPGHAHGNRRHPDCERGIVASENGENVFVRYYESGVLADRAKTTSPRDLERA